MMEVKAVGRLRFLRAGTADVKDNLLVPRPRYSLSPLFSQLTLDLMMRQKGLIDSSHV